MARNEENAELQLEVADAESEQDEDDAEPQGDDRHGQQRRRARQGRAEGIPLENLLRLLAGERVVIERRQVAGSNAELIAGLRRSGMLSSDAVARAMQLVPRGSMVPLEYAAEAWVDSPIRVEEHDYNISAPHMHAQLLEALEISPGDRVLDVGTGCGFIAAAAAVLTGKPGCVVGVDTKDVCIQLCKQNVSRLTEANAEFASSACPITFFKHNVFIPSPKLKGNFNKVCVGATVPADKVHLLMPLLEPGGGLLLAPVDNDLRLYMRSADGRVRQRLVSSVRFSDLEVPSDAGIALSVLEDEQAALMKVQVSPSTLVQDLQQGPHKGCGSFIQMWSNCFKPPGHGSPGTSPGSDIAGPDTPMIKSSNKAAPAAAEAAGAGSSTAAAEAPAGEDLTGSEHSASGLDFEAGSDDVLMADPAALAPPADEHDSCALSSSSSGSGTKPWQAVAAAGVDLGEPDLELRGPGWLLTAHKQVLKGRVAHFRAKLSSSMRDADDAVHQVPESFSQSVMEALLHYCYEDELPQGLEPADVVKLLQAAAYYSTPRLIELCEERLVGELLQLALAAAAAEAPHLLCLADELGLVQLRQATTAFIALHYHDVQASEGWSCLDKHQVELVASQLAAQMMRLKQLLGELEPPSGAAALPKRRAWW